MYYNKLSEKVLLKRNEELLELHKRVIKTYLAQKGITNKTRRKFFKLYDRLINKNNILCWFYTPTVLVVRGVVIGEAYLLNIQSFYPSTFKKKKHRKSKKKDV